MEKMTLDQFLQRTDADVQAFAAATRAARAEGVDGFDIRTRTREDWWREVAAYFEYSELADIIAESTGGLPCDKAVE